MPAGSDAVVVDLGRRDNPSRSTDPPALCDCALSSLSSVWTFVVSLRPRIMGIRTRTELLVKVESKSRVQTGSSSGATGFSPSKLV